MYVKVVASPSSVTRFQHKLQQRSGGGGTSPRQPSSSFSGIANAQGHQKKRSVVSSSSQLRFTALAQMAAQKSASGSTLPSARPDSPALYNDESVPLKNDELLPPPRMITKSESTLRLERVKERIKRHQCCVAVFFLVCGLLLNGLSYYISVQLADYNKEVIDTAVANHENVKNKNLKLLLTYPSKYIIGLFSFLSRVTSAIGTFFLAQAVVTWLQKRRSPTLRSASGHAEDAVGELHGGCSEIVGDFIGQCIPAFG